MELGGEYEVDLDEDGDSAVHAEEVDVRSVFPLLRLLVQRVWRSGAIVCVKMDLGAVGDGASERMEPPDILCDDEVDRVICFDCI